jgi:hypothetical protein
MSLSGYLLGALQAQLAVMKAPMRVGQWVKPMVSMSVLSWDSHWAVSMGIAKVETTGVM